MRIESKIKILLKTHFSPPSPQCSCKLKFPVVVLRAPDFSVMKESGCRCFLCSHRTLVGRKLVFGSSFTWKTLFLMLDQTELLAHSWTSYYEQVGRLHWLAPDYQGLLLELCSHAAERGKYLHPQNERFLRSLSLVSLGRTYHLAIYLQESLGNLVYLSGFWLEDGEINYGLTTSSVFHTNSKVWLYHTWFRQDMIHPLGLGRGPPSLIIFASSGTLYFPNVLLKCDIDTAPSRSGGYVSFLESGLA